MRESNGTAKHLLSRTFAHPSGLLGRLGGFIMSRENRRMARRAIRLLGVRAGDRVLEVGCGPGVALRLLLRAARSVTAIGIDPSEDMLEQARRRNAVAVRAGRVVLRRALAEQLPFTDAAFDKALAIRTVSLWTDRRAGLGELSRVLKPGGGLVLGLTEESDQNEDRLLALLAECGFVQTEVIRYPGQGQLFAVGERTAGQAPTGGR